MLAHLRTDAYEVYRTRGYPPDRDGQAMLTPLSYEENLRRIAAAKNRPRRHADRTTTPVR